MMERLLFLIIIKKKKTKLKVEGKLLGTPGVP